MAMPGVDEQITSGVHRTGGQFYDLYPARLALPIATFAIG